MAVPPFVSKLYEMANEATIAAECFAWSEAGDCFWITNGDMFARDVLPAYFKHNNYASFVRQLNLYGFRRSTDKGRIVPGQPGVEVFRHPAFIRGRKDLIADIHRKAANTPEKRTKTEHDDDDATVPMTHNTATPHHVYPPEHASVVDVSAVHQSELMMLRERTTQLEAHAQWLEMQNAQLAAQQRQQAELVSSLVTMLTRLGVADHAMLLQAQALHSIQSAHQPPAQPPVRCVNVVCIQLTVHRRPWGSCQPPRR